MAAHGKTESLSRQKIDGARRQEDGQRRTSVPKRVHKQQAESGPKNQKHESYDDGHHPSGEGQAPRETKTGVFIGDNNGIGHSGIPRKAEKTGPTRGR